MIGRSIYGVVVIDGSLCSRFYGMEKNPSHSASTWMSSVQHKHKIHEQLKPGIQISLSSQPSTTYKLKIFGDAENFNWKFP